MARVKIAPGYVARHMTEDGSVAEYQADQDGWVQMPDDLSASYAASGWEVEPQDPPPVDAPVSPDDAPQPPPDGTQPHADAKPKKSRAK